MDIVNGMKQTGLNPLLFAAWFLMNIALIFNTAV